MTKDTHPLWEQILTTSLSEDELYERHFSNDRWTSEEFATLMNLISPEFFRTHQNNTKASLSARKRIVDTIQLHNKFLATIIKEKSRDFQVLDTSIRMSAWKFIKWAASNEIPLKLKFFKNLPIPLMELFLEFRPINTILRTGYRYSKEYHRAYYLKQAEALMEIEGRELTPTEIYRHPHMEGVERYLQDLRCKPKKRTILEKWLPKICNCVRGRPRKTPLKNTCQ